MYNAVTPAPQSAAAAMIPKSPARWQLAMRDAITDPLELLSILQLDTAAAPLPEAALRQFPLRVPRSFVARMRKGDPKDPLLLQVLPQLIEDRPVEGFGPDPVGDLASERVPGLLHKYQGRALLITTAACALHCRYCFRREFPYYEQNARSAEWQAALEVIRSDPSIEEVILSGGDPLSLSDGRLSALAAQLDEIPHLQRLRVHTRQPIVLPERVDEDLLDWLAKGRLKRIVVLHCNHAQEIDNEVAQAIERMAGTGALLLNQSVLLRDVNSSVHALADLSRALCQNSVTPYYLHQLDKVSGSAQFAVPDDEARQLHAQLTQSLSGYMVPRLVRELPGEASKTPLGLTHSL